MGLITGSQIIASVLEIIQDEEGVVWETDQALGWINDAQLQIVGVRADSSIDNHSILLDPGTKQSIDGLRLMSVHRNMGNDGQSTGRAIKLIERGIKDDYSPDWHSDKVKTSVKEYMYDIRTPKIFYVWPPVHATTPVYIEVSESIVPADLATVSETINVSDSYKPAIVEWVLYRFMSRDSEETSIQDASFHFNNFFALLGEKIKSDVAVDPKSKEHLN